MRAPLARIGVGLGAALVVGVGVLLAVLPSSGVDRPRSVFATTPSGLRALYLLCETLGPRVEPWTEEPGRLPSAGTLLVLAHLPDAPPELPASLASPEEEGPHRSRDLAHYRRFVEQGGTLLVLDAGREELAFLRDTLGLEGLDDLESVSLFEVAGIDRGVVLAGEERLQLGSSVRRFFQREGGGVGSDRVLLRAEDGSALALAHAVGAGRVVLSSLPIDGLDNRALAKDAEPALAFVRVLEGLGPLQRVLFDEYALGGWRPRAVASLAFGPRLVWLSVHALLVLLLLGWQSAAPGPFPRDPVPWLAASPLARAQGFGRTLARAGRFDLLARLLRDGLLARWEARAGRRPAPAEAADLAPRLRALARGDAEWTARLAELFARAPSDERGLARLAAELDQLEGELFPSAPTDGGRRARGGRPFRNGPLATPSEA